jgi:NDP-sugar pyrophosphorylase family protein
MVVSRSALDSLPAVPGAVPKRLWWPALEEGKLGGAVVSGTWHEVGTPADYLETVMRHLGGTSQVHPSASVDPSATITNSFIGRDATVEGGAEIIASVIGEGAVVSRGASIHHSVVLGALRISVRASVDGQYLAEPLKPRPFDV